MCVKNRVNFLALQETKMESIDLLSVKLCWGNLCFDHVHSDFVGNSGGILCVWDPNSFSKNNVTISDYFVIIQGMWLKTNVNLLIVVVYAPQDLRDKRMLWDYLTHVSSQWDGEVVMMGDFNEVRFKSDRNTPGDKSNAMQNLMYKMKFLKVRIRGWLSTNRNSTKDEITRLIGELAKLDEVIDNGNATDDTIPRRLEVLNSIQNLNQIQETEAAQKAKIK
ncbi:RNA-directed DNA polymerase, eukaryota, partial [Tanacetum coccineum]